MALENHFEFDQVRRSADVFELFDETPLLPGVARSALTICRDIATTTLLILVCLPLYLMIKIASATFQIWRMAHRSLRR
jgi:hypothetical protein